MDIKYNYITVYAESEEPLYILRLERGSSDELTLIDIFLEHRVKFESTDKEAYELQIELGGEQYILTADELVQEHEARGFGETPKKDENKY